MKNYSFTKLKTLIFLIFGLFLQSVDLSLRDRRWTDLARDDFHSEFNESHRLVPTKIFCGNHSGGAHDSPIKLGSLIGVHRRAGQSRQEAMLKSGIGVEEDSSMLSPKNQTLRFNKRYTKIRDLLFYQNDGEKLSFQFQENETSDASVRGEDWDDEFIFGRAQFQFATQFIEKIGGVGHQIMSSEFPVEMELIHYKASDGSLAKAWTKHNVLIISILFKLVSIGTPALTPLLSNIPYVAQSGPLKLLHAPVNFRQLLPMDDSYFTYVGSYTFTPCYTKVKRIVFRGSIDIDDTQLNFFRYLIFEDKKVMLNNFQPLQPINGRKITYYERGIKISYRTKLLDKEKPSRKIKEVSRRFFNGSSTTNS